MLNGKTVVTMGTEGQCESEDRGPKAGVSAKTEEDGKCDSVIVRRPRLDAMLTGKFTKS